MNNKTQIVNILLQVLETVFKYCAHTHTVTLQYFISYSLLLFLLIPPFMFLYASAFLPLIRCLSDAYLTQYSQKFAA